MKNFTPEQIANALLMQIGSSIGKRPPSRAQLAATVRAFRDADELLSDSAAPARVAPTKSRGSSRADTKK